ncbi:MAG: hypothetical protein HOB73_16625 [Planctomycetaceae bacterium]|jgi:hypothetical protein|nr:hypothetical protein [Planctomycetaceae bacterium]
MLNRDFSVLHSDPDFPVGKSVVLPVMLSFYEGTEIEEALDRLNKPPWLQSQ